MENKNVKVIDEHNIDRDANIITGFVVDNVKYVLYSIGRDEESDNLFVSKLADNFDRTSNMVNIEDNMEKTKISEIVKDLVTYSLRNENDKAEKEFELPGNNKVALVDVMFNKEQNINVTKTYVSTVKKSVTKVSNEFYKIDNKKEVDLEATTVFEPLSNVEVSMPELNVSNEKELEIPKELLTPETKKIEPEINFIPLTKKPGEEPPKVEEKVPEINFVPLTKKPGEEPPKVEEKEPEINFVPLTKKPGEEPAQTLSVNSTLGQPSEQKLFFDGSNESNLNKALGESSTEKVVVAPQDGVNSLREFGVDEPTTTPTEEPVSMDMDKPKTLTRSKGFANNKFFMVIAIAFFLAACIFLGYEAFQYFQLRG